MTIRIKIENLDTRDGAIVSAQEQSNAGTGSLHELNSGESVELYVHSSQKVIIKEIKQP